MKPASNPEMFLAGYAKRSGRTREEVLKYQVVATCSCDYDGCEGWQVIAEHHLLPWRNESIVIRGGNQ